MDQILDIILTLLGLKPAQATPSTPPGSPSSPLVKPVPNTEPVKHDSSGRCPRCARIMDAYQGLHRGLRDWFEALQEAHPEAHVSDAGRGRDRQEEYFNSGASKAHYGESSHNCCAAVDIFKIEDGKAAWPRDWYEAVVKPRLDDGLCWYGDPKARFQELPHVELAAWREMLKRGDLRLVE